MVFRIGIDIGGAFTDLVGYNDDTGELIWVKDETTPHDPSIGVLKTISKSGIDFSKVLSIIHGQTLVINTIIERKGAKVGLITTKGFRDVLELQRSNRRDMYNFRYQKPDPIVPRYLRLEVEERVTASGEILKPLKEEDVKKALEKFLREGVESICISFINSYANPTHELRAGEIVQESMDVPVTLGHEITREWREYERTMTAVLNAYVKPKLIKYLTRLEEAFKEKGFKKSPFVMLSNGGVATFDIAKKFPIYTIESGPVAGVIGGVYIAKLLGDSNVIVLDGGSTTTKASLIEGLIPRVHTEYYVERTKTSAGYPVRVPVVDTFEIGNGGTSIAWIDSIGNLRVGPKAAGAYPGPACYGKGGTEPTVTDAYVVNGLINPEYLLGGAMRIHKKLAHEVIKQKVADHYNISVQEAAEGIIKLANENAAFAIRVVSVQRGYDPRDFTLIVHGGSGPMFAPFIAQELEIKKIIVPVIPPGVFSAWGMLTTDIRHDLVYTEIVRLDKETAINRINDIYSQLESKVLEIFKEELGVGEAVVQRFADMRYYGQEHTVKVPIPSINIISGDIDIIINRFHEYHERAYAFRLEGPVEIVNFHVVGEYKIRKFELKEIENSVETSDDALIGERRVYLNGDDLTLSVYNKQNLAPHFKIDGPAIIEDPTSTILVLNTQRVSVDKYGNVVISERRVI
ncbi:Acetophenone carboxylase gamma subunit [Candidatus Calditenuaceae archaeon HR02]|nr:Acetophenone carboxylase gamma subunit [Candidatus Calditenuaceae archaeon HR02]